MDGRWLGRDPIGEVDEFNLFTFNKNTIFTIDFLGLIAILSCLRYKWTHPTYNNIRYSSICYLYTVETKINECCLCKKELDKINKASNSKLLIKALYNALKCMKKANPKITYSIYGPLYANLGNHDKAASEGEGKGTNQRIPEGWYRITPYNSSTYGPFAPGITGLNITKSGSPVAGRGAVLIHNAWGNIKLETQGCLAFINGADKWIKNTMLCHTGCGGTLLEIVDMGDASDKQIKSFSRVAHIITNKIYDAVDVDKKAAIDLSKDDYSVPSKILPTPILTIQIPLNPTLPKL